MSWNLVDTVVLHVRSGGREYVIKAAGRDNHHIGREIRAHLAATGPLTTTGSAARMVEYDRSANLLITEYLGGELVAGSCWEFDDDVHRQAGALLRSFHNGVGRVDASADSDATAKTIAWLDKQHRIETTTERDIRAVLRSYRPRSVHVVPTHGDWQPRNWLFDDGVVRIIDFGRFDYRPPSTDFCRLDARQWRVDSGLEAAFFEGYGDDPRDPDQWRMLTLREAVGTAVWAYQVGDVAFEQQGHRMIADALRSF